MNVADPWEKIQFSLRFRSPLERYGFSVFVVAASTALTFGVRHLGLFHASFMLFYPAIVLVAMCCGFGPGILATALAATSGGFFFLEPFNSFTVRTPEDVIAPALFALIGVLLTFLTHSRSQARQALRITEDELNRAQSVAQIGSWHYDIEGGQLRLSDEACRILGPPVRTALSLREAWQIVHPSDRDRVNDDWTVALAKGDYDSESRVVIGGETRWVRVQATIEKDADRRARRAVGTIQDITDRKLAADRLQEYEKAMEGLEEMILVVDRDYRYVIANQAFLASKGATREQLIGHSLAESLGSHVFNSQLKPKLDECFQGNVIHFEKSFQYPALGERDFSVSYFPISGNGEVERVAVVMQDVTEKKQADQSLRLFRTLIDESNDAVEVVDPDTLRFLDINEKACRNLGYTREEMLRMTVFDINPGVDEPERAKVVEALSKGGFVLRQGIHRRKDGSTFPVETSIRLVQLDRRSYVVAVSRDISERQRAEEALLASEDRYRDLVEHSEDLVCTHDLDGRLLSVNEAPARILGYTPEELLKIPMRDLIIPEGRAEFDAYLERLKNGSKVETGLLCVITRSGGWRTWEYRNTLRTDGVPAPIVRGMAHDVTERRLAELALHESEERLSLAQEIAHIGTFDRNLQTGDSKWTPQMEAMYGLNPGTFPRSVGQFLELVHPKDRQSVSDLVRKSMDHGEAQGEWRVEWPDGTVRWITGHWRVFKDASGQPVRAIGIDYDITERKRTEEALRNSEERYRLLFEKNLAGVAVCSLTGQILDCNEAWAQMLGYDSPDEIRGHQTREFYANPADRESLLNELKQRGTLFGGEVQLRKRDGSPVWVLFDCVVHRPKSGEPTVQATAVDISERKRAEEALKANEERFRVALKGSPTAVFSQDRELRYTWIYNFASLTAGQVLGKTDDEILGAEKARRMRELKQQVLKTGKGVREDITISYNGSNFAYDLTLEPILDSAGKVIGITGAAMDIARLREMADQLVEQRDKLVQEKSYLEGEIEAELGFEQIIGKSSALRDVLKQVRIVAPTDSTVLLLGETGTGKELVARALHALSSRHDKSFIKLNCAAVPSGLLESELFGHEKGAFTSAISQKLGRLELADGGTLFLDEVGELPLELQPKLLRVLQDREFERLGGVRTLHVDVRIISATNCDLQRDVADRNFREDLFYRLNVFPISLPPLRDRRSDIPMLVSHFVGKYAKRMGRHIGVIPTETMQVLQDWNWPGNVRELENMVERMVILSKGNVLAAPPAELRALQESNEDHLVEMERDHIIRVLRETNGVLAGADGAASRLGIKRTTLQSMLKRFGIEVSEYRRGAEVPEKE